MTEITDYNPTRTTTRFYSQASGLVPHITEQGYLDLAHTIGPAVARALRQNDTPLTPRPHELTDSNVGAAINLVGKAALAPGNMGLLKRQG